MYYILVSYDFIRQVVHMKLYSFQPSIVLGLLKFLNLVFVLLLYVSDVISVSTQHYLLQKALKKTSCYSTLSKSWTILPLCLSCLDDRDTDGSEGSSGYRTWNSSQTSWENSAGENGGD